MTDPTQRFTDRVADYARYRPGYPGGVLEVLESQVGLRREHVIADIGSGTGISTELLLGHGNVVYAVEPNDAMRAEAERRLGGRGNFRSVAARAEATTLADHSVDLVTAFQAFHWFDVEQVRREFERILRDGGQVALVWNDRKARGSALLRGYEQIVREYCEDSPKAWTGADAGRLSRFFGEGGFGRQSLANEQVLDYEGLKGRLLSASYAPKAGHPNHEPMLRRLRELFEQCQSQGRVRIEYETRLYYGRLVS
jgi:SAM-dependent methyltransferase